MSAFYEEGEGVYSATVTAGSVLGSDSVSIDISNGQTSVTISSDQLTIQLTDGGNTAGCTVSTNTSTNHGHIVMIFAAILVLIRRRYFRNL